jgi:hypothetical protein
MGSGGIKSWGFWLGFMMPHHDLEEPTLLDGSGSRSVGAHVVFIFGLRSWVPIAYHTIGCFVTSGRLVMTLIRQYTLIDVVILGLSS